MTTLLTSCASQVQKEIAFLENKIPGIPDGRWAETNGTGRQEPPQETNVSPSAQITLPTESTSAASSQSVQSPVCTDLESDGYIRSIRNGTGEERQEAIFALVEHLLFSENPTETLDACIWAPLIETLRNDSYAQAREAAAYALGMFAPHEATDALIEALYDRDDLTRAHAAFALGKLKAEGTVQHLIRALRDSHERTRMYSAQALGFLENQEAIEPLKELLYDTRESSTVRESAAHALQHLTGKDFTPEIESAIRTFPRQSQ